MFGITVYARVVHAERSSTVHFSQTQITLSPGARARAHYGNHSIQPPGSVEARVFLGELTLVQRVGGNIAFSPQAIRASSGVWCVAASPVSRRPMCIL